MINGDTEKLITLFQQTKNTDYLLNIYNKYLPMINHISHLFHFSDLDKDDVCQEALIVCYHTASTYNSKAVKVTYGAYFKASLFNKFRTLKRKEQTAKRMAYKMSVPLDTCQQNYLISEQTTQIIQQSMLLEQIAHKLPRHADTN